MKKSVTYDVDIQLGREGNIIACQCDCTAGMGPGAHCKHVRTMLYGLLDFKTTSAIIVELSCTDRLQSFHQPKKLHSGSPVKSQDLGLVNDHVLFDPVMTDDETDEQFTTRVRNLSINHALKRREHMPLLQTYGPANSVAMDTDHDYLELRQSDLFLQREFITKITEDEVAEIERLTRGQNKNPAWQVERTKRIQSSNFGKICKATAKRDMDKLASSLMEITNLNHIRSIRHGIDNEDSAIKQYQTITGNNVTRAGIIVDTERPYLGTSVDGIFDDKLIEVKCPYVSRFKEINPTSVPYLRETPEGLELHKNHDYYYQIQGQLHITKKAECHLVVYTLADMKILNVFPDEDFKRSMLEKLDMFFINHFRPVYLRKLYFNDYSLYSWY